MSVSDILRDHGLGKGLNAADKKALIDIVNVADTNQSTVKTNIVNALNAVSTDKALGLVAASTWADIQAAIPQVKTGKRWASGTGKLGSTTHPQGYFRADVSGLSFTPTIIIVTSDLSMGVYSATYTMRDGGFNTYNAHTFAWAIAGNYDYNIGDKATFVNATGFNLALINASANASFKWFALE
ncbi:hypothetical protein ACTID9_01110 [Brevibacillus fluminis]|uniref:hypothetical protein n=1 Tax=Brevibacillus fluminis TaxID=511487 RepID=UPI003F8A87A1